MEKSESVRFPPAAREAFLKYGAPWILYGLGTWAGCPVFGCLAALLLLAGVCAAAPRRIKPIEMGLALFFLLTALRLPWLIPYQSCLAPTLLAVLAFGSLAVGRPFTLSFARECTHADMWRNPHFLFVNRLLTALWGLAFLFCAGLRYWDGLPRAVTFSFGILVMFLAALFTKWFPQWYRREVYLKTDGKAQPEA